MATLAHWKCFVKDELLSQSTLVDSFDRSTIEDHCRQVGHRWRKSFWDPTTTLLTFLLQVISEAKTLRAAVALLLASRAACDETVLASADPSAYCQARIRLPEQVVHAMVGRLVDRTRRLIDEESGWQGHPVYVVDGSSASMPDTPALQEAFPQPAGQQRGCGFPIARFVAVFCWATGAVTGVAVDKRYPHELTLFRRLWPLLPAGAIAVADRAYGAYVDMARLHQRGVFCLFRLHQRRKVNLRKAKKLGHDDWRMTWPRPARWWPSCGVGREVFDQVPETLPVRLVRIATTRKGFRSRTILLATTLLDPVKYPADEIRALYRDRWTAELNLRSLKTSLGMDVLRGESPDLVRKEIGMHLLAYNLIRLLMWQAAREHGRDLHRLSFVGTLHRLQAVLPFMMRTSETAARLTPLLLQWIANDQVPHRPDRVEPRRKKRRPKPYSLLTQPRDWYRKHGDEGAR